GAANLPSRFTVRLDYTAGPLERTQDFAATPTRGVSIPLEGGSTVKGVGQAVDGRAFVAIAVDVENMWSRLFDVVAIAKDGREIRSMVPLFGGPVRPASGVAKFDFDLPLLDVAKF